MDLKTKFLGEQEVLKEFPDATILRIAPYVSYLDDLTNVFKREFDTYYDFIPIFSDLQAKKQIISDTDVAESLLNCLKIDETKGKIVEIGGPHIYTVEEIYEIM